MSFVWKYQKEALGPRRWSLLMATVRRPAWDEELSAAYLLDE